MMVSPLQRILLIGSAWCLAGWMCARGMADEGVPKLARRELVLAHPMKESPAPLPAVTVPEPRDAEAAGVTAVQRPLTLVELQQLAQQFNPTLVQAQCAVRAAQGRQIQAGLYPNPEVGYTGEEIGLEGAAGQQGAALTQEVVTGGKLALARSAAGHGVAAVQHRLEAQRWRVMNAVRAGFYEVLLAQETVRINQDLVRVGDEAVEITTRLREAQEVGKAEVLQAKIEAERAQVSLFKARNRYRIAWYELAAVVGQAEMPPAALEGDLIRDLPVVTWDEGLGRLLSGSPELAQARAKVQEARCNVALQSAERSPNFTVEGGVKYDDGAQQTLADVGVAVPLRIYDRNQGNIVAAQAELIAATREVERLELELFNRFAKAFEGYSNGNRQVQLFRSNVLDNARESLELVAAGYRQGEFDYLSLLTAQRTYIAANLEYLEALRELWQRSVELDGLMLTGGLDAIE